MLLAITPHEWAVTLVAFVFGCAVGSFLNVCIWRMPSGLSVIRPNRSFCPRCRTSIAWFDNVPLLSFLALGGRCRHCGGLISWRYFLVEGITGLLLAGL
ncbi:MAG: prepilin peptidase, partial [Candidatus Brocadiia bacterium]|nr:prepilin peptidase [Candidatus Brocadiia bacterium]